MPDRPHPDRRQGVFETLLVVDGCAVALDAHLGRLAASLTALYGEGLRRSNPDVEIRDRIRGTALGSVRVTVAPADDGWPATEVEVREVDRELVFDTASVAAHSLVLDGGLGAHKWADRSLLEAAQSRLPTDALPLVLDRDGAVLETSRANVFVVSDGVLFTPPLDGRILPGTTRAQAIEVAAAEIEIHEAPLTRNDLLAADEVFLTSSVRGVERVRALDGTDLATGDGVVQQIAAELLRTWVGIQVG